MKKLLICAALIGAAMMCLCSCAVGFIGGSTVRYDNADKYTAGDREISEKIDTLDIDWSSGKVNVKAGSGNVTVKETTKGSLDDKYKVHTWAEGSTLHVRFCKSGERYKGSEEKTLEITLPSDTVYEDIKISTSSGDISCEGVNTKKAKLDSSSGELSYSGDADSFEADSSSGNISFSGRSYDIKTDSSSGNVSVTQTGSADSISVYTSSGKINIDAEYTAKLKADSSSGDKTVRLSKMPKETRLDSSSGNVTLYLPEDSGFTAEIDTSSGDIDFELPLSKTGDETYVCGSGENTLVIDTSSGDVKIKKL